MNNLGIQNNRFHQQAIFNRIKTKSPRHPQKKRNQYYESWLQQKENELNRSTESCMEVVSPNQPQVKIPNSFQVKSINDINQKGQLQY